MNIVFCCEREIFIMKFYGTGAAEGIPNPFCSCEVCQNAREQKGKEVRRRSMFRLNEQVCIDLGADSFQQALEFGDLIGLHHVLITHTHEDHLAYMMMNVRNMAICLEEEPLHFYFTDKAYEIVDFYRHSKSIVKGMILEMEKQGIIAFHQLSFEKPSIIAGLEVIPLKGNHFGNMGEHAANYLIKFPDGNTLYYGLDTGWYLEETFKALESVRLDILISECTFGLTTGRGAHPNGHLDAFSNVLLLDKLAKQHTLHQNTKVYFTHINHYTSNHQQLVEYFEKQALPCAVTVAWDGLEIGYITSASRLRGGLYGLLVGDALGVPYEFSLAKDLPLEDEIDMEPPTGFQKAYAHAPKGTWSDDGSQALCLLESLLACHRFDLEHFSNGLLNWLEQGHLAVDEIVFDVGVQTRKALYAYSNQVPAQECGYLVPDGQGNGALMRVLPLALWHRGTDIELVTDAHQQCLITHGHTTNQVCCALYCLVARRLLTGVDFDTAQKDALETLKIIYQQFPDHNRELNDRILSRDGWTGTGTGYVVDCLHSAFMILKRAKNYKQAVKQAILLGNDTDTTACVTGGLAGILFGFEDIPQQWVDTLRNKKPVEELLQALLSEYNCPKEI